MSRCTVAVTGGTGFIGRRLITGLLKEGHTVIGLHRRSDANTLLSHFRLFWISVDDEPAFRRHEPNVVVHLATCYGDGASLSEVLDTNVVLPLKILEWASSLGRVLFLNADTYFTKPGLDYPHMQPYTAAKAQFVRWAELHLKKTPGLAFLNCRLEHVYGPGDGARKFVAVALDRLGRNEPLELTAGAQLRDFIHVDDVIGAFITLVHCRDVHLSGLTTIEVGTGITNSLREFIELAKGLLGSRSTLDFGALPYREQEIMQSVANTSALRRLGWEPRHDIRSGLRATLAALNSKDAQFQSVTTETAE